MRRSAFFLPTLKENPKEAEIVSHRLMLRAGMVRQASAGIYSWLPLGFRVLKKIEALVREEQDRMGCQEILMPTIQSADLWRQSGRYDAYGPEMLRITDRQQRDMLYGPTNEELITDIFAHSVRSYRDLPKMLYHIQWKFRDEVRPRFGVMRGREFLMKDAYSFDLDFESARRSYNKFFVAYLRTFARLGLRAIPMEADTGPIGGNLSHEFIILAETGESQVFCDRDFLDVDVLSRDMDYRNPDKVAETVDYFTKLYARTDETRGVHKAPANEVVRLATGLELLLTSTQQAVLNPHGINCLRWFEGRGYRVWGARTASSEPEWKYLNVRRYCAYLEHSIERGTQWAAFEPNGPQVWSNVRSAVEDFLFKEFSNGRLLGTKPEEAYFVRCDRTTMTQDDLDNGRLVCLVGVAPLRPAEFVIFHIAQQTADARA